MDKTIKLRLREFITFFSKSRELISKAGQAPTRQPCEEKIFNIGMSRSEKQEYREFLASISRFEKPISKAVESLAEMLFNIVTSIPDFADYLKQQKVPLVAELLDNVNFQKLGYDGDSMIPGHHGQVTVCGTNLRSKITRKDLLCLELALVSIEDIEKIVNEDNIPYHTCWIRCKVAWISPDYEVNEQIRSIPYPGLNLLLQPNYYKISFQKRQSYSFNVDFESCDYEEYKRYPNCLGTQIEINPHEALLNMDMSESEKRHWRKLLKFSSHFKWPIQKAILTLAEMLFEIFPSIPDFENFVKFRKVPLVTQLLCNYILRKLGRDIHSDDNLSRMTLWGASVRNETTQKHPLRVELALLSNPELQKTADPICTCWIQCKVVFIGPQNQEHQHIRVIPYPGYKHLLQPTDYERAWGDTQCYSFTTQFRRRLKMAGIRYPNK